MEQVIFQQCDGCHVSDAMITEASQLFNKHYGRWAPQASEKMGVFAQPGNPVRLGPARLRAQCLTGGDRTSYVRVTVDGVLAGNAFACRWQHEDTTTVCWVTQLVVHSDYRERGLATGLLNQLRQRGDHVYGIASSHPAACMAAAKAFGHSSIDTVRLDWIRTHAEAIVRASPTEYIRDATVAGSLFDPEDTSGRVSSVDTNFWIDHTGGPLQGLAWARANGEWPLGDLHGGHEFLLLLEARRRGGRPPSG